jgi:hypothetical protein
VPSRPALSFPSELPLHRDPGSNARDLRPAITSVLIAASKLGVWVPTERIYELPDASFLCEYFGSVGKLLEDGQLNEARGEALSWKPFLDRTKAKPS